MSDIVPRLSIVVPTHNNGPRLQETLQQLVWEPDRDGAEIITVENGSSDDTWEIVEELALGLRGFPARIFRSEVGLDAAYPEGAPEARGRVALLTADDLPFGVTGARSWEPVGDLSVLVIGSKAHPGSAVPRSRLWVVMSWGHHSLRRVILSMTVGDCQETLFVNRIWLQRHILLLWEHDHLTSTEIVHLAQVNRRRMAEVPVVLQAGHECGGTRIRITDVWDMAAGLVGFRWCRHMPCVVFKKS